MIYYAMKGYSPYENIRSHHYPHILVTAGVNDKRVPFYEPLKYVAKLRALKSDKNLLLTWVYDRGHFASVGLDYVKEQAFITAFLLRTICGPSGNCTDSLTDESVGIDERNVDNGGGFVANRSVSIFLITKLIQLVMLMVSLIVSNKC